MARIRKVIYFLNQFLFIGGGSGSDLPSGYTFLIDNDGNYLIDNLGNYLVE